ncbi:phage-like element PBSX protein XkdQ [Brevibacillus brevis]|uniref:XkdQ/YqbQ family protein n=1 Tax=Brevibacillus brevis TaxID=1393 RepID=UPI0019017A28|nr:hypothetical protein [Brevibacillus brevis]MBH0330134.1 phage-like element PBSX protein XkdQ [Brevibacillus brevis]
MLDIVIDNRNGTMWNLSQIVSSVTWKTSQTGKPSSVELTFIKGGIYQDTSFSINSGDVIRIISLEPKANIFYGYVFEIEEGQDEDVKVKAYDQIRYLMANDTYVFKNVTATEVLRRIASDFNLKTGELEDTRYKIPAMIEDGKKLLDIICNALDKTLLNTGKKYILLDDFGSLSLRNTDNMLLDFIVGDQSLMVDYNFIRSIEESYNRVKLVQDNNKTKKRDVYIVQDSSNIAKWGKLQLYQKVDDGLNRAQVNQILQTLIQTKNREMKKFRIEALGDVRVRAGNYVRIMVGKLDIDKQPFRVDECTHKFDGGDHTMTLELRVI